MDHPHILGHEEIDCLSAQLCANDVGEVFRADAGAGQDISCMFTFAEGLVHGLVYAVRDLWHSASDGAPATPR